MTSRNLALRPARVFIFLTCCTLLAGMSTVCGQPHDELIATQVPAAVKVIDAYHAAEAVPAKRTLHIVYWTPSDRDPAPQYRERLTRVLFDIRSFYLREMQRLGFGGRTIRLAVEADGMLKVHMVRGREPYAEYDGKSGSAIRKECLPVLQAGGIDAEKETLVIFCNMSNWNPQTSVMSQNSPYYASGGLRNGTAWQVDSPLLDSDLISKKEPLIQDGQYGKISVGKYNSIFVGGVCHELGHALGLPHNHERETERPRYGTSLMGSGNRTYGEDRRGEGLGSFLTLADGLRLASHPLFTGSAKGIDLPENAKLSDVEVVLDKDSRSFKFTARVTADPPAYAVIGYMDPSGGSDYDATTTTAVPDANGRFNLRCDALKSGKPGSLRVVVCQANGGRINDNVLTVPYSVSNKGIVDLTAFQSRAKLQPLIEALTAKDSHDVQTELKKLEQTAAKNDADALLLDAARALAATLDFKPGPSPAAATGKTCRLSESLWKSAKVGWGAPVVNRLPNESVAMYVGGHLFARGLYAHAPSSYTYQLAGKWSRLTGSAGLADNHDGSVVFVIQGDGKELWRSRKIADQSLALINLDVSNIKELTLTVENAGDGNSSDWGVWVEPNLER
jgi:hypothetical protein